MNRSLLVVLGSLFLLVAVVSADDKEKPKTEPDKSAADKGEPDKAIPDLLPIPKLIAKNKELVPALIARLNDPDAQVRQTAAYILANIGRESVPGLVEALSNKDAEVRANAAYVLGALGKNAQDALPPLVKALKDEDPDVRQRVVYAIQRVLSDPPQLFPPLPPVPAASKEEELPAPKTPAKDEPKKDEPKKDEPKKEPNKDSSGSKATPGVIRAEYTAPARTAPADPGLVLPLPAGLLKVP